MSKVASNKYGSLWVVAIMAMSADRASGQPEIDRMTPDERWEKIVLPAQKIAIRRIAADPCGAVQRIREIDAEYIANSKGLALDSFEFQARDACKASRAGITEFELTLLATGRGPSRYPGYTNGYIDVCSYDPKQRYDDEWNVLRVTIGDYSEAIRGGADGGLETRIRQNPCLKEFIVAGLTGREYKPSRAPAAAAPAPPPPRVFPAKPSIASFPKDSSQPQRGAAEPQRRAPVRSVPSVENETPSVPARPPTPVPTPNVATVPPVASGPKSGEFDYSGPPVPQNGEIVFSGLPLGKLNLSYDQKSWAVRISPGDGGTQRIVLRSIKSGTQKSAHVTWSLE